ncbi:MAG: ATP synthase F1 subunit gamma [Armatimonadota bacterium]
MASTKQIRQRIRIARNIQQITRAMKLVAAARFKRAQDRALAARPYATKMRDVIALLAGTGLGDYPLLQERKKVNNTGVVVMASDRGMCGGYNASVLRKAQAFVASKPAGSVKLVSVGLRSSKYFKKRGLSPLQEYSIPNSGPDVSMATKIANQAVELFTSGQVDEFYVVYNRFRSALVQIPTVVRLLPVEQPKSEIGQEHLDFLMEPDRDQLLGNLLPRYLLNSVFQTLLECNASEHGARMTAMSSATENAGKMISTLSLQLNRIRQSAITTEITEVVSGAEALNE